jgi:quinoprotein relay system zinc metallohydrolase 2
MLIWTSTAPRASGEGFEIAEVAPGVFVHAGVHANVDDPRHDDIANTGFIVGNSCIAVIDTGGSIANGRRLLEAIRSRTSLPICYVINTHVHYDHVLGNVVFRGTGAKFVGHAALAAAIAGSRDFFLEQFASDLGGQPGADAVVGPELLVEAGMELDLGDRVISLRAHSPAHTTSDLSIYDARTETLWLGDLLFMERLPALDGSLRGWLEVLAQLEIVKAARVVPGHGPAVAPWPAAAADQRRYLERLLSAVREGIARGEFLEQVVESAAWEESANWLLFDAVHRRNVTRAFTELEWE